MARKSKLTSTRGVNLYREDEDTLKRAVKAGQYSSLSDAIRESVNTHLTAIRLKTFRNDTAHEEVKNAQKEVIQPLVRATDKVENNVEKLLEEMSELKSAMRVLIAERNSEIIPREPQQNLDFENIKESVNKILATTTKNYQVTNQIRITQFMIEGLLTFFAIGYQAGTIKPTVLMKEAKFVNFINDAVTSTMKEAGQMILTAPDSNPEEILLKKFAQSLFNKLHSDQNIKTS